MIDLKKEETNLNVPRNGFENRARKIILNTIYGSIPIHRETGSVEEPSTKKPPQKNYTSSPQSREIPIKKEEQVKDVVNSPSSKPEPFNAVKMKEKSIEGAFQTVQLKIENATKEGMELTELKINPTWTDSTTLKVVEKLKSLGFKVDFFVLADGKKTEMNSIIPKEVMKHEVGKYNYLTISW